MSNHSLPEDFVFSHITGGEGFFVSKQLSIGSNGASNIHIRNPHADKVMWLAGLQLIATGNVNFKMVDQFDSITDGTEITIQNALMDEGGGPPDTGPFEAYHDSTYTAATDATVPLGFTRGTSPKSEGLNFYPSAVEPGREVIVELDNQEGTSNEGFVALLLVTSY